MRYTECRLAPSALLLTTSLDEDVVDFAPNYDGRENEPTVLPAAFPNLLVNGASGIAVGMATNIAPHNLVEVVAAARHLLAHPRATLDDLMRFVPGPDLPGGGRIIGLDGVREAYETGRGAFRIRATAHVENVTPRRKGIVVTELPYNVGPEKVIVADQGGRRRQEAARASPPSTTSPTWSPGLRLVIEIKNGFHPEAVLEQLYALTPMEDSFNINAVALVDGPAAHARPARAARGVRRAPPRGRTPPHRLPPAQGRGAPAPRRSACSSPSSTSTRSSR